MWSFAHVAPVVCFMESPFNAFQKSFLVLNGLQQISAAPSVVANRLQVEFSCLFLEHFLTGTERTQLKNPLSLMELVKNLFLSLL